MEVKKSSTEEPRPELSQKNNNQADWGEGFVLGRQEEHEQRYRGRGHCWLEMKVSSAGCKTCCEEGGGVTGAGVMHTQALGYVTEESFLLCLSHQVPTGLPKDSGLPIQSYVSTSSISKSGGFFLGR